MNRFTDNKENQTGTGNIMKPYYTHAGSFHADDAAGYVELLLAGVVHYVLRLEDLTIIPSGGVVGDIGRHWDEGNDQFDHHQGFFTRPNGYPYATAGMIWKKYGFKAVNNVISESIQDASDKPSITEMEEIAARVDEILVQGIDAHDADSQYHCTATCSAGSVRVTTISNVVSMMNTPDPSDGEAQLHAFGIACNFLGNIFRSAILSAAKFIEAKKKFAEVAQIDCEGAVIILYEGLPWKEIVHEQHPDALFVISPSNHPGNPWSMVAVPVHPERREVKKQIERPEWFKGFIHQGKWIAGGNSPEELRDLADYNFSTV